MRTIVTLFLAVTLGVAIAAAPAHTQGSFTGGHVETSELFAPGGGWATAVQTPGMVAGAPAAAHLVFSEVAPRGFGTGAGSDSSEYIEIHNSGTWPVALDHYYLSDDIGYFRIVNGAYPAANATDFALRFPAGLTLNPGRALLVCVTKSGFATSGGTPGAAQYFLEMRDTNGNPADDMIVLTTVSTFLVSGGNLTNPGTANGEWLVLYSWDGASDLVCDVDYASWGANSAGNPKMNKTGATIDGPDADALPSAYAADVAAATQTNLGTILNKPQSFQRVGGEVAETLAGGNGCRGRITPTQVDWETVVDLVRFHIRWTNSDPDNGADAASATVHAQEFGVFLPDQGLIQEIDIPALAPDSFFDVFFEVPLSVLPPSAPTEQPGNGPAASGPCPPPTNWNGNLDIVWNGPGYTGQIQKHYGELILCPGAPPSFIHVRSSNCPSPAPWTIAGLCPGFTATLVNEDRTPAPNPVPSGWTGWIAVSAAAGTPPDIRCCFTINLTCDGAPAVIDVCATTCICSQPNPTLSQVTWENLGTDVRFHLQWRNDDASATSLPVSGDMTSQEFGVFRPTFGPIGHFEVPPLAPDSFFDIFFDVPRTQLPPEPPMELPGGGPPQGTDCPPSQTWAGNVDVLWTGQTTGGNVQKHQGELLVNLGSTPSFIHVGITNCPSPAPWTITGLCPGFSAMLVNEDKSPAPNPIPSGWSGWIRVSAATGAPGGTTCCIAVSFDCNGSPGVIDLCATSCTWPVSGVIPVPADLRFGIFRAAPNPTAGGLMIDFALPGDGAVRVDLFDLTGRLVRTLVDGAGQAGVTSILWDGLGENGRPVAPGVYFIKLNAAGRSDSRKVMVAR